MTPLDRLLSTFLPRRLVPFALALAYAFVLAATFVASGIAPPDLLYLDVQDARQ